MNALTVTYNLIYNSKNITRDIADYLLSLTYSDKVKGESDELEIVLHDKDLLWQNDWYPKKGDTIQAQIIDGLNVLNCGAFTVDELELSSSRDGDIFTIKALAEGITKKIRTKNSSAHENKTLRELANTVAAKHGFTVGGNIEDIRIGRITQYQETDLAFLDRIASTYGYVFSIRDKQLIFTSVFELEKKQHILSIDKTEMTSFSLKDNTIGTFKKAKVRHHNAKTNNLESYDVDYESLGEDQLPIYSGSDSDPGDDHLPVYTRVENKQQAELVGKAKLHEANDKEKIASVAAPGNVLIVSGVNIEHTGCGTFSGIYHVKESTHSLSRGSSYTVTYDSKKVQAIDKSKHRPKKKAEKDNTDILKESLDIASINHQY